MTGMDEAVVTADNDKRAPSKEYDWSIKGLGATEEDQESWLFWQK